MKGILRWGDEPTNDATVWLDDTEEFALNIRLDLRGLDPALPGRLAELLERFGFVISDVGEIRVATEETIRSIVAKSNAQRFVEDPRRYFDELSSSRSASD